MLVAHRWPGTAAEAVLLERRNRFLAVCRLGRQIVEAHVPDRGRCLDLLVPGRRLAVVKASGPLRKTRFTALLARSGNGTWVSLDPAGAPRLVEEALNRGLLSSLAGLRVVRREVTAKWRGLSGRIDLLLDGGVLCEVKSVGAQSGGIALFPDAPTDRGVRHLRLLAALARKGQPCALVFCAQRGDVGAVGADAAIDPAFAAAIRRARTAGVRVCALRCAAHLAGMEIDREIPVVS